MQLMRYRPAPPLDRFIECFWWSHRDEPQEHSEHMLPSGAAQLLFALHKTPILCRPSAFGNSMSWSGSIVHGPQSSYYVSGAKPKGDAVGVSFRPGAAGAVLGVPMAELADSHVPLDAIWGAQGVDLQHRLLSAVEPKEIFRILEQSLSARIHRPLLIHPAIAHALASHPVDVSSPSRVAEVQRASGFSPRHFIALFHAAVGLNPKHYYRIRRFNCAVRSMAAGGGQGLGDIAAATGYSDQAHLTREIREFAGVAPTKYRPSGVDRPLHHRVTAGPDGNGG
ncbi:MAG TPA: helix-turn-helix domain-containing protein [Steroidobacteraceae bacterium]